MRKQINYNIYPKPFRGIYRSMTSILVGIIFILLLTNMVFGQHGLVIDSMKSGGSDGIHLIYTKDDGVHLRSAGGDGIYINRVEGHGIRVETAVANGVYIETAFGNGLSIDYADNDGLVIVNAGSHGINVQEATAHGVLVKEADGAGVLVGTSGLSSFYVDSAGTNGLHVSKAGQDGIYVGSATDFSMNIQGDKGSSSGEAHIAQIYNRSTHNNADVLRLQLGRTAALTASNNFITYYDGDDTKLGEVQGNGSGGICHTTSGCDYAEFLPVANRNNQFQPGDVVGVHDGKISHLTEGAAQVMVITDRAAVLGNMPPEDQLDEYQSVSFIGQIPVRIKGKVRAGDWIVPSGNHDGIAIAVPATALAPDHLIVGRAWESSDEPGVKRVNTVVGLDHSEAFIGMFKKQEEINASLQEQIEELKDLIMDRKVN